MPIFCILLLFFSKKKKHPKVITLSIHTKFCYLASYQALKHIFK